MKRSQRNLIVFCGIVGILTLTSALLMALAPAPLPQGPVLSLFALESPRNLDTIFSTGEPVIPGRWKYIYIHHSQTASGDAMSLGQSIGAIGDHFIIGNGDGAEEGEIQISPRWMQQASALPPPGARTIDPSCISICVVGDFDRTVPSPTQLRRLEQLVGTLKGQLHVGREQVLMLDMPRSAAGAGRYFPATAFRNQLTP